MGDERQRRLGLEALIDFKAVADLDAVDVALQTAKESDEYGQVTAYEYCLGVMRLAAISRDLQGESMVAHVDVLDKVLQLPEARSEFFAGRNGGIPPDDWIAQVGWNGRVMATLRQVFESNNLAHRNFLSEMHYARDGALAQIRISTLRILDEDLFRAGIGDKDPLRAVIYLQKLAGRAFNRMRKRAEATLDPERYISPGREADFWKARVIGDHTTFYEREGVEFCHGYSNLIIEKIVEATDKLYGTRAEEARSVIAAVVYMRTDEIGRNVLGHFRAGIFSALKRGEVATAVELTRQLVRHKPEAFYPRLLMGLGFDVEEISLLAEIRDKSLAESAIDGSRAFVIKQELREIDDRAFDNREEAFEEAMALTGKKFLLLDVDGSLNLIQITGEGGLTVAHRVVNPGRKLSKVRRTYRGVKMRRFDLTESEDGYEAAYVSEKPAYPGTVLRTVEGRQGCIAALEVDVVDELVAQPNFSLYIPWRILHQLKQAGELEVSIRRR